MGTFFHYDELKDTRTLNIEFLKLDISNRVNIDLVLTQVMPDFIFHLADKVLYVSNGMTHHFLMKLIQ